MGTRIREVGGTAADALSGVVPDPSALPKGQLVIYRAIVAYYARHGTSPVIRELIPAMGAKVGKPRSTNSVVVHLLPLARKGLIIYNVAKRGTGQSTVVRRILLPGVVEAVRRTASEMLRKIPRPRDPPR